MNFGNWSPEDVRLVGGIVIGAFGAWLSEGFALLFISIRESFWDRFSKKRGDKSGPGQTV